MDIGRQLAIVRRWLPLIFTGVVVACVATYLVTNAQPRVFGASARLVVGAGSHPQLNDLLVAEQLASEYAVLADTRDFAQAIIGELHLSDSPEQLLARLTTTVGPNTAIITVSARDSDAAKAADLANTVAELLKSRTLVAPGADPQALDAVDTYLAAIRADIARSQTRVDQLLAEPSLATDQATELAQLQERISSLQSNYAALLPLSSASAPGRLTTLEGAVAVDQPVAPRPLLYALLAAVVGLLITAAIAFVLEYLDDTLRDSHDVELATGLPILAWIKEKKGRGRRPDGRTNLVTLLEPRSPVTESYRSLRAILDAAMPDKPIRALLVTSGGSSTGKTITAANLAVVYAQTGRRVLLVDADLHRPALHSMFDMSNERGLTTLLAQTNVLLDQLAQATEQTGLRVLPSGPLPPSPIELLGSPKMRELLIRLAAENDLIILDSPALPLVSDAAVLSAFMQMTLLVVPVPGSHRPLVDEAREALTVANAALPGTVIHQYIRGSFLSDRSAPSVAEPGEREASKVGNERASRL